VVLEKLKRSNQLCGQVGWRVGHVAREGSFVKVWSVWIAPGFEEAG
jgi:hypothetical protein